MPDADPRRGLKIITELGCAACHTIPGVEWPQGRVGPSLEHFPSQTLIAGTLPNRPDMLAAFLADAPSLVPGTGMPPIAMSSRDAQDAAAYLYAIRTR